MLRICVDMDEVIADTLGEHLRRYNEASLEEITLADLWGKGLWDVVSTERQELLRELLHAEDFFEDLPVMPDAPEVLHNLAGRFEIFIATQAMSVPNSFGPKYRWLQRHFLLLLPTQFLFIAETRAFCAPITRQRDRRPAWQPAAPLSEPPGLLYSAPRQLGCNRVYARSRLAGSCRILRGDVATHEKAPA